MSSSSSHSFEQYELDCQMLHCYFSGNGRIDNRKLVEILAHRNSNALKFIRQTYRTQYGQDLLNMLSAIQMHTPVARVAYLGLNDPEERDAEIIRYSLFGGGVNLNTLVEITCTRPPSELQNIKQAYRSLYKAELEKDVITNIHGGFKEIMLAVLKSSRNHGLKADMSMAMCDAKTLFEAIESGKTIDKKAILLLLSQRNTDQIKAILVSYKQLYGHKFYKSLKQSKCEEFGKELSIVIKCMQSPEKFFAKQLRMRNGDFRETLIRTVITRSEIDIKEIDQAFAAKTGSSLENLVRREFNNSKNKGNEIVIDALLRLIKGC